MKHSQGRVVSSVLRSTVATVLSFVFAVTLLFAALVPTSATALDVGGVPFVPNPKTAYAGSFLVKADGQQWFLDAVEQVLNLSARSINTLNSAADLNIVTALSANKITSTGSLPPAIGELRKLRFLFLGDVNLSGAIPTELYMCTELENLDLSGNALTGGISSSVGNLTKLKVLLLHNNQLTGSIPAQLGTLPTLENLDLAGNKLTGGIPASLYNITTLKVLALSNNQLGGDVPAGITTLANLRVLLAWNCGLTGTIPSEIGNLSELQILDLSRNKFTGTIPSSFSSLAKLEELAAADNQLGGGFPDIWAGLAKLKIADLSNNRYVGDVPAALVAKQTAGAKIYIDDNYLHGANTAKITHNQANFTSDATTDYQVRLAFDAYTQIKVGAKFNVYAAFTTIRADTDAKTTKAKLPAAAYEVVLKSTLDNPAEYFRITSDANGIYIELLKTVSYADAITFELRMLPYDAAALYTFVSFDAGTEAKPTDKTGGGGSSSSSATKEEEPPEPTFDNHSPYITGFTDGMFRPDAPITREQVAAMIIRILEVATETQTSKPFPDVNADRWSAAYIAVARDLGYFKGYEDGSFQPAKSITRAELATLLVRDAEARGVQPKSSADASTNSATDNTTDISKTFSDVDDSAWYAETIAKASALGYITGYTDGTFKPNRAVTRAEAVTMVNRAFERDPVTETALQTAASPFSDVTAAHWAYLHILEASVLHEHEVESEADADSAAAEVRA